MDFLLPSIRTLSDGTPRLDYTAEAKQVMKAQRSKPKALAVSSKSVHDHALMEVRLSSGDVANRAHVLGQYRIQFGQFHGKTFLWIAENGLGWAAYVSRSLKPEIRNESAISYTKFALREYIQMFPEGRRAIEMKEREQGPNLASAVRRPGEASSSSSTVTPSKIVPASSSDFLTISTYTNELLG